MDLDFSVKQSTTEDLPVEQLQLLEDLNERDNLQTTMERGQMLPI